MATDVKVGDKVRVTYEGTVGRVCDNSFSINDGDHYFFTDRVAPARTVEIVERAKPPKPKVGDVIKPSRLRDLPNGTALRFGAHDPMWRALVEKRGGGWFFTADTLAYSDDDISWSDAFTVLYIPE